MAWFVFKNDNNVRLVEPTVFRDVANDNSGGAYVSATLGSRVVPTEYGQCESLCTKPLCTAKFMEVSKTLIQAGKRWGYCGGSWGKSLGTGK